MAQVAYKNVKGSPFLEEEIIYKIQCVKYTEEVIESCLKPCALWKPKVADK